MKDRHVVIRADAAPNALHLVFLTANAATRHSSFPECYIIVSWALRVELEVKARYLLDRFVVLPSQF